MASKPRFDKKKKRWAVDYYQNGQRRRKLFQMKENATDFWRDQVFKKERIGAGLGYVEDITFEKASHLFEQQHLLTLSKSYQASELMRFRRFREKFQGLKLSEMDAEMLGTFVFERLQGGASNKTVLNDLSALSALFRWAMARNYAAENPVEKISKPAPLPRRVRRALTDAEMKSLLAKSCPCCFPSLVVLANTGIRTGELEAVEKKDFDLKRHVLILRHQESSPIKGKAGRTVPLNDFVEAVIRRLPEGKILALGGSTLREHFKATRERAGIDACLHELRHTYLTALVSSNVDLKTAQKISGHKRTSTLEKYLHWTGPDLEGIRNRVTFAVTDRSRRISTGRNKWDLMVAVGKSETTDKIKGFRKNQEILGVIQNPDKASPRGFEPSSYPHKSLINKNKKNRGHR